MSLPKGQPFIPKTYIEDFNSKHPCPKQKNHTINWNPKQEFLPQLFGADLIEYWGHCTACLVKVRAVWTFHNIIQEKV